MKGKLHYRIKNRQSGQEQNWVKDFTGWVTLFKLLYTDICQRAETIHIYYSSKK